MISKWTFPFDVDERGGLFLPPSCQPPQSVLSSTFQWAAGLAWLIRTWWQIGLATGLPAVYYMKLFLNQGITFPFLPNQYVIGIHSIFKIDIFWTYKQKSAVDLMRQSSVWGVHSLLLSTAGKSVSDTAPMTSSSRRDTSYICSRRNVTINSSISTETKNTDKQMWRRPWLKTVRNIYKANHYVTYSREK